MNWFSDTIYLGSGLLSIAIFCLKCDNLLYHHFILLLLNANIEKDDQHVDYPSKLLTATQPQPPLETTKFRLFPMLLTMGMQVAWPLELGKKRKRL